MNHRVTDRAGKLLYFAGPGDVVHSFEDWRAGVETPSETTRTYSGEAFRYCAGAGRRAVFISSHPRKTILSDADFVVENRPKPRWRHGSGLMYHLQEFAYGFGLLKTAIGTRPAVVVVDSGTLPWSMLILFRLLVGARVYATFHNAYHPMRHPFEGLRAKVFGVLDGFTFRHFVAGCLAASEECRRQYEVLAGGPGRCVVFNGLFDVAAFRVPAEPVRTAAAPPCILFAGRIEAEKGVFDLLEACERLAARDGAARFDLAFCGNGSALPALRERVAQSPIRDFVTLHGRLAREQLLVQYRQAHAVVVPTQSGFAEGYAMVCAEAVVCGVPVVASDVVPAAEMLSDATLIYPANDVGGLAEALRALLSDAGLHARLKAACPGLAAQFFDPGRGLGAAMGKLIDQA